MTKRSLLLLAVALIAIPCCGWNAAVSTAPSGAVAYSPAAALAALASPSRIAAQAVPPPCPSIHLLGRFMHGAYGLEQYPAHNVTSALHRAVFAPVWDLTAEPPTADPAYALYCFDMTYFEGEGTFLLDWEGTAPEQSNVFIGLGNFTRSRWEWYSPPSEGELAVDDLTPYVDAHPYLLLAVLVIGDQPAQLNAVQIGPRIYRSDVDMSQLTAPVMQFEADALRTEWDSRSPVADSYQVVAMETDASNSRRMVVSHVVDGNTHYGAVVVPQVAEGEWLPVIMVCHPGAGGVGLYGEDWFFGLLNDSTLKNRFIIVMPSFRSEQLGGGALGFFTSGGEPSMFDRDADDAIALLDCVLANITVADPDIVLAVGWSRGAQVVMRMAERDTRIKGIIEFAGMTDEWTIDGQSYMYGYLNEPGTEPDPSDFYYRALWELSQGQCDIWQARSVIIRTCIVYHAASLPRIQIHHGVQDPACPISLADRLADTLALIPGAQYEYFRYENGDHSVGSLEGAGEHAKEFLLSYLQ